jgi:hypothetical protein
VLVLTVTGVVLVTEFPVPPPPEYCGIFRVLVLCVQVDAPLVPVVVRMIGRFVRFEALPLAGVPNAGVTIVQEVVMQNDPEPLIPVHVQVLTLELGAPNNITLLAEGTALGELIYHEVVMAALEVIPQELATTEPGVAFWGRETIAAVDPVPVNDGPWSPSVVVTVVPLSVIEVF